MCRNITTLRGLEPAATPEEVEAAARQYVRKVSGVQSTSAKTEAAFEKAVRKVTAATEELLATLPPRQNPPPTEPPLRRIAARQAGTVSAARCRRPAVGGPPDGGARRATAKVKARAQPAATAASPRCTTGDSQLLPSWVSRSR
jgi:hypothetical protein